MKVSYKPKYVCAKEIKFELKEDVIKDVEFVGGCPGNALGLVSLLKGMKVKEAINRMEGIHCRKRPTSCPDQLARALQENFQT